MPREDRRLIFTYEEAYKAIYALCVQKELKKPPPGAIASASADPEDEQKFIFRINNHQDNSNTVVRYGRDFLAAALMLSCRSSGIPLPKRGQKSVMLRDNTVILRIII